ncbi:glycosyltransferase family 4 protein [Vibrio antiquarius]|uniref:glycosyltransferase n=1 Tax=Vibrio antiquarius (strain Ex25) TaxID=150340 RepID=UPI00265A8D28|nr:glycosyltransferase family 4 protein [Vibrio antiquarius]MCR9628121.1 glycosyltransferase family 4 protein [Vibrio antiquarius]MCR9634360.1 glycosyltransferase family 4 protein [Vibrio antiquarius]
MKKKLLFVHDHVFLKDTSGDVYSPGGFPSELWGKYLEHFDNVTAIGRCSGTVELASSKYVKSSCDNVEFTFVERISSPRALVHNLREVQTKIESLVRESDCVIARLPSENGLLAVTLAKKLNKPLCVEVVGCAWDGLFNYGSLTGKIYAPLAFLRMKKAVRQASYVLYVTNDFLQKRYPANSDAEVVSASNVSINVNSNQYPCQKYKQNKKKLVFGLVGNYKTKYKGIHFAIDALSKVDFKKHGLDFEFRVLGKGEPEEYIEQAKRLGIENKVFFDDPLPSGGPVHNWLDNIDIYIQPSLQEGLPRALIEAMSRGCVAIGSTAGGIPELLQEGYIHKAGSISGFVKNIEYVLSGKDDLTTNSFQNFCESLKYDSKNISSRRRAFFKSFSSNI